MSTASSANTNPYFNSNRFKHGSDSEAEETTTSNDSSSQSKNIFQMTDDDDDDDFTNYFKFSTLTPSKIKAPSTFNTNIEHHFKQLQKPSQLDTPPTIRSDSNDSTVVVAPVIRSIITSSLDSTPTISSLNNTTIVRGKKSTTIKKNVDSKSQALPSHQKVKITNEQNPFEDETTNAKKDNNPFEVSNDTKLEIVEPSRKELPPRPPPPPSSSTLDNSNTSKELLVWCQNVVEKVRSDSKAFKNLKIKDFTKSWSDGRAFCAVIYHYRPSLM